MVRKFLSLRRFKYPDDLIAQLGLKIKELLLKLMNQLFQSQNIQSFFLEAQ